MTKEDLSKISENSKRFTIRYNKRNDCLESVCLRNWSGKQIVAEHVDEGVGEHIEALLSLIPQLCEELDNLLPEE